MFSLGIMIKHGEYHVSLAAHESRLFLSQNDPPLILYKHSDNTLRNDKGDKCVITLLNHHIYLFGKLSVCNVSLTYEVSELNGVIYLIRVAESRGPWPENL